MARRIMRLYGNQPARVRPLRHAAVAYATHGWAVMPGAFAVDGRCGCQRPGCRRVGVHPLVEPWEPAATTDILQVARWWARQAWAILLPTGYRVEVIETPAELGRAMVGVLGDRAGPVAVMPGRRWLLFCAARADAEVVAATDEEWRAGLLLHTRGSWVPVPPNGGARGRLGWFRPPWIVGWRLPPTQEVLTTARIASVPLAATSTARRS
jgi:Bifunctional DNA primase/polymerase, N-terminal